MIRCTCARFTCTRERSGALLDTKLGSDVGAKLGTKSGFELVSFYCHDRLGAGDQVHLRPVHLHAKEVGWSGAIIYIYI